MASLIHGVFLSLKEAKQLAEVLEKVATTNKADSELLQKAAEDLRLLVFASPVEDKDR